jgi:PelA/Pel-15E family pectate lyase
MRPPVRTPPRRHAARRALACALAAGGVAASACGARAARAQPDSADVARLGALGARVERDTASLLGAARLAARPAAERQAWERYVAASRAMRAADRAAVRRELDSLGLAKMLEAPRHAGFFVDDSMSGAWFRSAAARRQTDALLSWQTPSGGWSKRLDMHGAARRPGMAYGTEGDGWAYVPTIDNGATTEQLTYLARALAAGAAGAREQGAFARGVRYLLAAQLPSGCWPQVYPLQGGYHDGATFNDDATASVLRVLRDAAGGTVPGVADADRRAAGAAAARGIDCVLRAQVVERDTLTAWGQQHDPLTLRPIGARSYEHASLAAKESATLVDLLMELPSPDARVVASVHAAADWFRRSAIMGQHYDYRAGLEARPGAGPIWARMYELGTGRPLFSNRDGVRLYDWHALTDRRQGYAWYTEQPRSMLKRYDKWARLHPRAAATAGAPGADAAPRASKQPAPR